MTAATKKKWSIITVYASAAALVGLFGYFCKAQDLAYNVAFKPAVEQTVSRMISDSTAACKAEIQHIKVKQNLNDTNINTIKYLLEEMATSDQIVRARNRQSNPTGIR